MQNTVRNTGVYVELEDGRKGVAYSSDQIRGDKMLIKLVNNKLEPIISAETNNQAIVFKKLSEIKVTGYIN